MLEHSCIRSYIANRVTDKLTRVTDYIYCCRSGSAADTQAIADIVNYHMSFHKQVHSSVVFPFFHTHIETSKFPSKPKQLKTLGNFLCVSFHVVCRKIEVGSENVMVIGDGFTRLSIKHVSVLCFSQNGDGGGTTCPNSSCRFPGSLLQLQGSVICRNYMCRLG